MGPCSHGRQMGCAGTFLAAFLKGQQPPGAGRSWDDSAWAQLVDDNESARPRGFVVERETAASLGHQATSVTN